MIAEAEADADADAAKACGVGGGPKLLGSISSCFDSYMARAARPAAPLRGRLAPGPNGNHLPHMATTFHIRQAVRPLGVPPHPAHDPSALLRGTPHGLFAPTVDCSAPHTLFPPEGAIGNYI